MVAVSDGGPKSVPTPFKLGRYKIFHMHYYIALTNYLHITVTASWNSLCSVAQPTTGKIQIQITGAAVTQLENFELETERKQEEEITGEAHYCLLGSELLRSFEYSVNQSVPSIR